MLYRRYGRTGLSMPVFSCGGMRYQDGWQDKPLDEVDPVSQKNLEATIHRAMELGINHVETARGYGCSERQLGLVLPKLPRDKIIIQTKVGPEADPRVFVDNFHDSLGRLRLDYVDLFSLHGINNREVMEWSLRPGGCFEQALKLREQGKCRFVGFSTHAATDVILDCIHHGEASVGKGFDYVNLHWYYIFQRNWPAIQQAAKRDMGVFIISPSDKGGKLYAPPDKLVELCKPLHPIVFNDLFCLTHPLGGEPLVHTLSVGAARPTDFGLHVETLALMDEAQEILPPILQRLAKAYADAVEEELREPFAMGLPEHEDAPGGINMSLILWLRNLAKAFDLMHYGKMRYNLIGNGGHWFPGVNAADVEKVDMSPALRGVRGGEMVPGALREAHVMLGGEQKKRLSQSD